MSTNDHLKAEIDRLRLELQSFKAKSGETRISIGNYLLTRLAQLGVTVRVFSLFTGP
jgi:pyruvate decarboxylase